MKRLVTQHAIAYFEVDSQAAGCMTFPQVAVKLNAEPISGSNRAMIEFLNTKLGLLIAGFVLTTIAGGVLNYLFQSAAWKRQQKYQLLAHAIVEGRDLFDELTELMNKRVFGLLRVFWTIKEELKRRDDDGHSDRVDLEKIESVWAEYYESVIEWNIKMDSIKFKLVALAGEAVSNEFLDYKDNDRLENPISIHYRIRRAHDMVRSAKTALPLGDVHLDAIAAVLTELQGGLEHFERRLTAELLYTAKPINELLRH